MPSSALTAIYTLSLHDALPICLADLVRPHRLDGDDFFIRHGGDRGHARARGLTVDMDSAGTAQRHAATELGPGHSKRIAQHPQKRSEEHTSELQSHSDLVCRLLRSPPSTLFPYTTLFRSALPILSVPIASMVTTFLFATAEIGVTHERVG